MNINFETLFENVPVEENGKPMLSSSELGDELLELIRDAKLNGVSGYQVVEAGFLALSAEGSKPEEEIKNDEPEIEPIEEPAQVSADLINEANGNPPGYVVTEEVAANRDVEPELSPEAAAEFISDVQAADEAGLLDDSEIAELADELAAATEDAPTSNFDAVAAKKRQGRK